MMSLPNIVETIKKDFESIKGEKYIVLTPEILHAGKYGVPQSRQRLFFIGLKVSALTKVALNHYRGRVLSDKFNPYPPPTHYLSKSKSDISLFDKISSHKFVSTKEAFHDLPEPWQSKDLSHKTRSKAKYYGNHMQGQIEVNPDELGPTIRAEHHGNIEFRRLTKKNGGKIENKRGLWQRRLSVRECARLQTFPDDYEFVINQPEYKISMSGAYQLVGDAVPPVLAYNIAMRIQELWPKLFLED
jgi:DNA (cytosine-5)-methyltransferase 1